MTSKDKQKIYIIIGQLRGKASLYPSFENGKFNKENAIYQTGIAEAINMLYDFLEEENKND